MKDKKDKNKVVMVTCPVCDGTGIDPDSIVDIPITNDQLASKQKITNICKECNGTGKVPAIITKKTTLPPIR